LKRNNMVSENPDMIQELLRNLTVNQNKIIT